MSENNGSDIMFLLERHDIPDRVINAEQAEYITHHYTVGKGKDGAFVMFSPDFTEIARDNCTNQNGAICMRITEVKM